MTGWKDNGEYWTKHGRIHHNGGGRYIVSVKKDANYVPKSELRKHGKTKSIGAT